MKIYDISQEVFGCEVYPGDPVPTVESVTQISAGGSCNLTAFSMCAHNGTHIDAPKHFYDKGKTIDQIDLEVFIGKSYLALHSGEITSTDAINMLAKAREADSQSARRLLVKGDAIVTEEAASVFAEAKVLLIGSETQSVGPKDSPQEVHLKLLGSGVTILEGIRLSDVDEGVYLLNAAPINLGGADGAPCRAVLIDIE